MDLQQTGGDTVEVKWSYLEANIGKEGQPQASFEEQGTVLYLKAP